MAISASFISGVRGAPDTPGLPVHVPAATDPEGLAQRLLQPICLDTESAQPLEGVMLPTPVDLMQSLLLNRLAI